MFFAYQLASFAIGVLACWAFWAVLLRVKPNLKVGTAAAFNHATGRLGFKIGNFGKKQIVEVRVRVAVLHRSPEGKVITLESGHLKTDSISALDPADNLDIPWALPTTFIVVCTNGAELLRRLSAPCTNGEHRIALTVIGRHSLSGTILAQRATYTESDIKEGWFDRGLTFSISKVALSEPTESAACGPGET